MAAPAVRYRESDLAVADAAFLAQKNAGHAELIGAFLGHKDLVMAVGAVPPIL